MLNEYQFKLKYIMIFIFLSLSILAILLTLDYLIAPVHQEYNYDCTIYNPDPLDVEEEYDIQITNWKFNYGTLEIYFVDGSYIEFSGNAICHRYLESNKVNIINESVMLYLLIHMYVSFILYVFVITEAWKNYSLGWKSVLLTTILILSMPLTSIILIIHYMIIEMRN